MNIFKLDENPIRAAIALSDIHIKKMIIENCQMLANCYSKEKLKEAPKTQKGNIRKYSYFNHPCSIFVRKSIDNFNWVLTNGIEMYYEYGYRFEKKHFCGGFLFWCFLNKPDLDDLGLTKFALAMPDCYKGGSEVDSYRRYYINEKAFDKNGKFMLKYTNRLLPGWMPFKINQNDSEIDLIELSTGNTIKSKSDLGAILEPVKVF